MTIRDFIYLDGDRLLSFYSQAFEGVAETIVQSSAEALGRESNQKGEILSGSSIATQVAEISLRTENKVLHDHMYNLFENKASAAIIPGNNLTSEDYVSELTEGFLVKVAGPAEVEDFGRMNIFLDSFNKIGEAIAYATSKSDDIASSTEALSRSVQEIKDRNQRAKASQMIRQQTDAKKLAQSMGLAQDPKLLENLKLFTELFARDVFQVTIVPKDNRGEVAYRAILNAKWLRVSSDLLRALYGNFPKMQWTLIGQITHIPSTESVPQINDSGQTSVDSKPGEVEENPSMRDPFRNMFKASSVLEKMFLESKQRIEVVVYPLAIYREYRINPTAS